MEPRFSIMTPEKPVGYDEAREILVNGEYEVPGESEVIPVSDSFALPAGEGAWTILFEEDEGFVMEVDGRDLLDAPADAETVDIGGWETGLDEGMYLVGASSENSAVQYFRFDGEGAEVYPEKGHDASGEYFVPHAIVSRKPEYNMYEIENVSDGDLGIHVKTFDGEREEYDGWFEI